MKGYLSCFLFFCFMVSNSKLSNLCNKIGLIFPVFFDAQMEKIFFQIVESRAFYMEELRNNTASSGTITKEPGFF